MKLSKAQQEVVDKMRDGWELFFTSTAFVYMRHPFKKGYLDVSYNTFRSLINRAVIHITDKTSPQVYRLTEQYKNEQK